MRFAAACAPCGSRRKDAGHIKAVRRVARPLHPPKTGDGDTSHETTEDA